MRASKRERGKEEGKRRQENPFWSNSVRFDSFTSGRGKGIERFNILLVGDTELMPSPQRFLAAYSLRLSLLIIQDNGRIEHFSLSLFLCRGLSRPARVTPEQEKRTNESHFRSEVSSVTCCRSIRRRPDLVRNYRRGAADVAEATTVATSRLHKV